MEEIRRLLGADPEDVAEDAAAFFAAMRKLPSDDLTAQARSADGWIEVGYSAAEGVRSLRLDPRALRMGSQELSETILALIQQARRDVESRAAELLDLGDSLISDRRLSEDRLRAAYTDLTENLRGANELMERLRHLMRP